MSVSNNKTEASAEIINDILDRIGDQQIKYINQKWESRPRSNIMKWLMNENEIDVPTMANILGLTVGSFNSKLARGSFSFDDLLLAATACDFTITFIDNKTNSCHSINPALYFSNYKTDRYYVAKDYITHLTETIMNEIQEKMEQIEKERKELESQMQKLQKTSQSIQ